QGLRDDPSLVWHLSGERLRQAAPGAATGALWYGDEEFVSVMDPLLHERAEVLEIGAGAGRVSRLVAPKVRRLVCTDLAETLLREAEANLAGHDNVEFVQVEGGAVDRVLGE